MSVTAHFEPASVVATDDATTLQLMLHNAAEAEEVVRLAAAGSLADAISFASETIYLEPGENFVVPVSVAIGTGLPAGEHVVRVEVALADGGTIEADATVDVAETMAYEVTLAPSRSSSSSSGKHRMIVDNRGNTPISLDVSAQSLDAGASVELSTVVVNVEPNSTAQADVRVKPRNTFWSGEPEEHDFMVRAIGNDGAVHDMNGTFEQRSRMPAWLAPAAAGMLSALVLGALAWFLLLKPSVESIAADEAEAAIQTQRVEFDQTLEELRAESEAARRLPLGTPADQRIRVEAEPGGSASESFTIGDGRVLSVTDVVFQNPGGAVGRVQLIRGDSNGETVLLESDLANFRDLDFHFVAPLRFDPGDTVGLSVTCEIPGPSDSVCITGATVIGFVDVAG